MKTIIIVIAVLLSACVDVGEYQAGLVESNQESVKADYDITGEYIEPDIRICVLFYVDDTQKVQCVKAGPASPEANGLLSIIITSMLNGAVKMYGVEVGANEVKAMIDHVTTLER